MVFSIKCTNSYTESYSTYCTGHSKGGSGSVLPHIEMFREERGHGRGSTSGPNSLHAALYWAECFRSEGATKKEAYEVCTTLY